MAEVTKTGVSVSSQNQSGGASDDENGNITLENVDKLGDESLKIQTTITEFSEQTIDIECE